MCTHDAEFLLELLVMQVHVGLWHLRQMLKGLAVSLYSLLHWGVGAQQTRAHKPDLVHCPFL